MEYKLTTNTTMLSEIVTIQIHNEDELGYIIISRLNSRFTNFPKAFLHELIQVTRKVGSVAGEDRSSDVPVSQRKLNNCNKINTESSVLF